jgi:natural product precursor
MKSIKLNDVNDSSLTKNEMSYIQGGKTKPKKEACRCTCAIVGDNDSTNANATQTHDA